MALAAVALAHGLAWCVLSAIAIPGPRRHAGPAPHVRFAVLVPAHNEERGIAATIRSLAADEYASAPEIVVVADNCTDGTAAEAAAAGASVIVRDEPSRRGKSHALDFGLAVRERVSPQPGVYVVVDADTTIEPGFFAAIASRLASGADVVQARYDVAPEQSPVARLRALAFALVHYSRPLGAARVGLGSGLKGNGMAFRRAILSSGFPGSGIAEDAATSVAIARRGIGVHFEPRAVVRGAMAATYENAAVQDRRWEGGRLALAPAAAATAACCLTRGRWRAAGTALDVASLPLTFVATLAMLSLAAAVVGAGSLLLASAAVASVVLYPALGWLAARVPLSDLAVLVHAPRFALHKVSTLTALAVHGAPRTWERTDREARP
jgi:cellulose synthase/poly-beta-1,6-N-acetylglucosamine synthase-like glycosyltransferase